MGGVKSTWTLGEYTNFTQKIPGQPGNWTQDLSLWDNSIFQKIKNHNWTSLIVETTVETMVTKSEYPSPQI